MTAFQNSLERFIYLKQFTVENQLSFSLDSQKLIILLTDRPTDWIDEWLLGQMKRRTDGEQTNVLLV